jgi:hypothetical protein
LYCLSIFISEFDGDDDNDDEDDENNINTKQSFQNLFYSTTPNILCTSITANQQFPRILYIGMTALGNFFDINNCQKEYCDIYAESILDFCYSLIITPGFPIYVKEEVSNIYILILFFISLFI